MQNLEFLTKIPQEEAYQFDEFIREARSQFIKSPTESVKQVLVKNTSLLKKIKNSHTISDIIAQLREESYENFLLEEAEMNAHILKNISYEFALPFEKFLTLYHLFIETKNKDALQDRLRTFFGDYAGHIYPYIYRLSLSNTQSRRSRAGKVFEGIIYGLYEALGYPYESQTKIGSKKFKEKDFGKMVDSLLPNIDAFEKRRDKVIIGTMKTTLRERWQEVIEEISRAGLPNIYLLTIDDNISINTIEKMANHNIILVLPAYVKKRPEFSKQHHVISFETYFFKEIPEKLRYWSGNDAF